ncbi:hypothetical protein CPB83DRAFT_739710, partial [Crepidotus variabilis]
FALKIAADWGWKKDQAEKLIRDLNDYSQGKAPFAGGLKNASEWWISLIPSTHDRPLKAMAVKIFSIVPHTAEVEQLFSSLGLSQSQQQTRRTVEHMETIGTLRNHYIWKVQQDLQAEGKSIRCKHGHMHTQQEPGINLERVKELTEKFTWVPDIEEEEQGKQAEDEVEDLIISEKDVEAEFIVLFEDGDRLPRDIRINEVYDMSQLDDI